MSNGTLNKEPPYAERHVRWCERSVNTKIGDKYLRLVFTSYSICGDAMQADEVAQEALLKAYVSMNRFEGGSFWAWIYKIAFRTYLDMRRTPAHATLSIQAAADIADSHTQADVGFRYQALHAALEQLPPRERMATLMHYINGYSIREIAQITDCTEAAVKQQLSRGRTHLKTLLTK